MTLVMGIDFFFFASVAVRNRAETGSQISPIQSEEYS